MKMLCVSKNQAYYIFSPESKEQPKIGTYYNLEDSTKGTRAQNNTFHMLIDIFYRWMLERDSFIMESPSSIPYDFSCTDKEHLKNIFKKKYGGGFGSIKYVKDDYSMAEVPKLEDVPEYVIRDFNNGNTHRIEGKLKSFTKYTKKQRMKLISTTINIMKYCGVNTKRFHEIIDTFEEMKK